MKFRALATGMGLTEGPVFRQAGDIVVTSIDQGRIYRISADGAEAIVDLQGGINGLTEGLAGILYGAQLGGHPPARPRRDLTGGLQLISRWGGLRWLTRDPISPNDLCFGPDGLLYATDPTRQPSRDDGRIWRCDVMTGETELLASVNWFPNGIAFGAENDALYVASTFTREIVRCPLVGSGLGKAEPVIRMSKGHPDGFAIDDQGSFIIGAIAVGDEPSEDAGVQVWDTNGKQLDDLRPGTGRRYTNVALSGNRQLIVTDSDGGSVLACDDWPTAGLALHPFRERIDAHR